MMFPALSTVLESCLNRVSSAVIRVSSALILTGRRALLRCLESSRRPSGVSRCLSMSVVCRRRGGKATDNAYARPYTRPYNRDRPAHGFGGAIPRPQCVRGGMRRDTRPGFVGGICAKLGLRDDRSRYIMGTLAATQRRLGVRGTQLASPLSRADRDRHTGCTDPRTDWTCRAVGLASGLP